MAIPPATPIGAGGGTAIPDPIPDDITTPPGAGAPPRVAGLPLLTIRMRRTLVRRSASAAIRYSLVDHHVERRSIFSARWSPARRMASTMPLSALESPMPADGLSAVAG